MSVTTIPLTKAGHARMKEEVQRLIQQERPKWSEAIARARELGDLKENAEYHSAKDQQGMVEARIRFLQHQLQHAQVIDVAAIPRTGKASFGVTVCLENVETEAQVVYQLVGEDEADLSAGRLSVSSPLGKACLGKQANDIIEVQTPNGLIEYELIAVHYQEDS